MDGLRTRSSQIHFLLPELEIDSSRIKVGFPEALINAYEAVVDKFEGLEKEHPNAETALGDLKYEFKKLHQQASVYHATQQDIDIYKSHGLMTINSLGSFGVQRAEQDEIQSLVTDYLEQLSTRLIKESLSEEMTRRTGELLADYLGNKLETALGGLQLEAMGTAVERVSSTLEAADYDVTKLDLSASLAQIPKENLDKLDDQLKKINYKPEQIQPNSDEEKFAESFAYAQGIVKWLNALHFVLSKPDTNTMIKQLQVFGNSIGTSGLSNRISALELELKNSAPLQGFDETNPQAVELIKRRQLKNLRAKTELQVLNLVKASFRHN